MDATTRAYCFLDTNVLIHFRTFDEVDWPKVLGVSAVTLVLAPVVLKEIDKLKIDQLKPWQQERARKLIQKFRHLLHAVEPGQAASLGRDLSLLCVVNEPQVDWVSTGLDPGWMDDRLIAAILTFKTKHEGERVVLVCDDFAAQQKARSRGIEVLVSEDRLERLPNDSPQNAELRQLRAKIQSYESRQPKLTLAFGHTGAETQKVEVDLRPRCDTWPDDAGLAAQLEAERTAVEAVIARAPALLAQPIAHNSLSLLTLGSFSTERESLPSYQRKAAAYIATLAGALPIKRAFDCGAMIDLSFIVRNDGTEPAEDLRIQITFPAGSFALDLRGTHHNVRHLDGDLWLTDGSLMIPKRPMDPWIPRGNSGQFSIRRSSRQRRHLVHTDRSCVVLNGTSLCTGTPSWCRKTPGSYPLFASTSTHRTHLACRCITSCAPTICPTRWRTTWC